MALLLIRCNKGHFCFRKQALFIENIGSFRGLGFCLAPWNNACPPLPHTLALKAYPVPGVGRRGMVEYWNVGFQRKLHIYNFACQDRFCQ